MIDALGLEKVVLVGNSMGCPVSLEVAHAAPAACAPGCPCLACGRGAEPAVAAGAVAARRGRGSREPADGRSCRPDYVRFGPLNALKLFRELTRFLTRATPAHRFLLSPSWAAGTH